MGQNSTKDVLGSNIDSASLRQKALVAASKMGTLRTIMYMKQEAVDKPGEADTRETNRQLVLSFLKQQKMEKEDALKMLENESSKTRGSFFSRRETTSNSSCDLCNKAVNSYGNIPCRVCTRNFHESCLNNSPLYTMDDRIFFSNALLPSGWSCHHCSNLCDLLTPEEVQDIYNAFESMDLNKDSSISEDEYVSHKMRTSSGSSMTMNESDLRKVFKYLDKDHSGQLDMVEFLNNEACMNLFKRPNEELVSLLTAKELAKAHGMFELVDRNADGMISKDEIGETFREWGQVLQHEMDRRNTAWGNLMSPEHRENMENLRLNMLWEADEDYSGTIDWDEYIKHQAIYILWGRPNFKLTEWS